MKLPITKARQLIERLNWLRMDATGGTRQENARTPLPAILAPLIATVASLSIPPRFTQDIRDQAFAVQAADDVASLWLARKTA